MVRVFDDTLPCWELRRRLKVQERIRALVTRMEGG